MICSQTGLVIDTQPNCRWAQEQNSLSKNTTAEDWCWFRMGDNEPGFTRWKSCVWPLLFAVFLSVLLSPLPEPLFSTFPVFSPHLLNCKPMTSQQRVWSVATTLPGATLQCCRNNNNTATDTSVLGLRLQLCVLLGHIQRSVSYSNLDLYTLTANHTFAHAFT